MLFQSILVTLFEWYVHSSEGEKKLKMILSFNRKDRLQRLQILTNAMYPLILLLGLTISLCTSEQTRVRQRETYYLLSSKNIINKVFAYNGNIVWSVIFLFISVTQTWLRSFHAELLPLTKSPKARSTTPRMGNGSKRAGLIREYCIKWMLKLFLLFVCFLLIDSIFVLTGGKCVSKNDIKTQIIQLFPSAEQCRESQGKWVGGFDISGHFCFLTNISLILWAELFQFWHIVQVRGLSYAVNPWVNVGVYASVGVLLVWCWLLLVTSIYYHTAAEKILGCLLGYVCPLVMYKLIPESNVLSHHLYSK